MTTDPIAVLKDLLLLLALERLDTNLFRGQSRDFGTRRVFGGQVLGQALAAASLTVEDALVHSLHAYFLRAGDDAAPIIYEVDRQRDGRSFASRRVVAIQHGRPILNLAASFQRPEAGLEHQAEMPAVPGPDALRPIGDYRDELLRRIPAARLPPFLIRPQPFDLRPVERPHFVTPGPHPPRAHLWFRAADRIGDDPALHRNLLTYFSDYALISVATRPHTLAPGERTFQLSSLDHALWFQRPFRIDEWMLYAMESPSAAAGRGLVNGRIYRSDGTLVACVTQEGVMRIWSPPAAGNATAPATSDPPPSKENTGD